MNSDYHADFRALSAHVFEDDATIYESLRSDVSVIDLGRCIADADLFQNVIGMVLQFHNARHCGGMQTGTALA